MKKRFFLFMMALTLMLLPLCGCFKTRPTQRETMSPSTASSGKVTSSTAKTTEPSDKKSIKGSKETNTDEADAIKAANAKAEQAYMDFLNGKTKLSTHPSFSDDDADGNYDGLIHGTYSYDDLKATISEFEGSKLNAFYGFLDCGNDGIHQMVLRFESVTESFLNWVGIINLGPSGLELNYAYEDGGRIFSELYTSGYLLIEGAMGAGAYHSRLLSFDKSGRASEVFTQNYYNGSFASMVLYDFDIKNNVETLQKLFAEIAESSIMDIRVFMKAGFFAITVDNWSPDAQVKASEEAIIEELVKQGVKQLSAEEMDKLSSLEAYRTEEVVLLPWGEQISPNDIQTPSDENISTEVYVDYARASTLPGGIAYQEFIGDSSEIQVQLVISCDSGITNVSVMELYLTDYTQAGEMVFDAYEVFRLDTLSPNEPFLLATAFPGDYAYHGLSYTDAKGQDHTRVILMSGMDGSVYFSDAIFN